MRSVVLVSVFFLAGCVSVKTSVLDSTWSSSPVSAEEVYIFLASEGDLIPDSCLRVALLHGSGGGSVGAPEFVERMRREAGRHGANAVYLREVREPGTVERVAGALLDTPVESRADATAYRCEEEDIPRGRAARAARP